VRARFTFSQMHPDQFGEVRAIFERATLPAVRGTPGNRGALLLIDRATGKSITVSLWEAGADLPAVESESRVFREQMARYLPLFTVPPVREEYEVVVQAEAE